MKQVRRSLAGDEKPSQITPVRERPQAVGSETTGSGGDSPARALQGVLASRISDGFATDAEEYVERWPRHQRLIFLVGSASALWAVTIALASMASKLI